MERGDESGEGSNEGGKAILHRSRAHIHGYLNDTSYLVILGRILFSNHDESNFKILWYYSFFLYSIAQVSVANSKLQKRPATAGKTPCFKWTPVPIAVMTHMGAAGSW